MEYRAFDCVDAGTEHCPCYLALTGDCLTCSRLRGEDCCDCRWRGVCIYNEFEQAGRQIRNPRKDFEAEIQSQKYYLDDLVVFVLKVGRGFALKATMPGACVFLRLPETPVFYQFPVSVMWSDPDRGEIHLAIKILSPKTKALYEAQDRMIVRGIYRNGIQGLRFLMERKNSGRPLLIVSKGVGFAPGVQLAGEISRFGSVDFVIDQDKISDELVLDYLQRIPCRSVRTLSLSDPQQRLELEILAGKTKAGEASLEYDKIALLTSDYYQELLGGRLREILPSAAIGFSNNARLCCGEGVCGSCTQIADGGRVIRLCKCSQGQY